MQLEWELFVDQKTDLLYKIRHKILSFLKILIKLLLNFVNQVKNKFIKTNHKIYLSLGSNLGNKFENLQLAVNAIPVAGLKRDSINSERLSQPPWRHGTKNVFHNRPNRKLCEWLRQPSLAQVVTPKQGYPMYLTSYANQDIFWGWDVSPE